MPNTPTTRVVLLPDDTALLDVLQRAEQLLEDITTCEQGAAQDPNKPAPWRLPTPVADGAATSALSRVVSAVHARLTPAGIPTREPRLLAPDGRYEHLPLRRVQLTAHDADTLAAAARVCQQALTAPSAAGPQQRVLLEDLRELFSSIDRSPEFDTHPGADWPP